MDHKSTTTHQRPDDLDRLTGTAVTVTTLVAVAPDDLWDIVSAMHRIGEFSPECFEVRWVGGTCGAVPGARFTARSRFPDGVVRSAGGIVDDVETGRRLAWTMVDLAGVAASRWRYDLEPGSTPGHTVVHHRFEHGPGMTGLRHLAVTDPSVVARRLGELTTNMTATLANMEATALRGAAQFEEAS
jgi:uncharacterized protein YndB with AHSA1/START domain